MGYILQREGVTTDPQKLKALRAWPPLKTKHQLISFLGLCTYYANFIVRFSGIEKPLTQLTEEKQTLHLCLEGEAAFVTMKELVSSTPVLRYPRPEES
jgi:hypothetical protein